MVRRWPFPSLEIKNGHATQHTLQIPPNASSITIEFPLRMLNKKQKPKAAKSEAGTDPALADGDVSMDDAEAAKANGDGAAEPTAKPAEAPRGEANARPDSEVEGESSLTWPWQPELSFNGRHTQGSWTAADALIDPSASRRGARRGGGGDHNVNRLLVLSSASATQARDQRV